METSDFDFENLTSIFDKVVLENISYEKYKEILVEGPPNDRYFTMCVYRKDDSILAYGRERTKKKAEQLASKNALIKLSVIEE